ncbi:MAG: tetratricopeptide repeat protein [Planctomycetota bacterium]
MNRTHRTALLTLFTLAATFPAAAAYAQLGLGRPPEADEALQQAQAAFDEERYEDAVAAASQAIEYDEVFVEALLLRADALKELEDYQTAIQSYIEAIDLDPKRATAFLGRGQSYEEIGQYDIALSDFETAYDLDRRNSEIAASYGEVLIKVLGDAKKAIKVLDKAIELDPENAEAWSNRGWAKTQLRDFEEAAEDLTKSAELDPENHETYATLANVYLYEEEFEEAIGALEQAIANYEPEESTDPEIFVNGYIIVADARLRIAKENPEDPELAKAQYEAILVDTDAVLAEYPDQYPESGLAFYRRGVALRMLERYSEAIKAFNDAIQIVPPGEDAQYLANAFLKRGICWHYQGQDALARGDFEEATSIDFDDPLAHLWTGFTYAQEGDYRQAIDAYGEAIARNQSFSLAYVNRALAYVQVGSFQKAINNFNQAIRNEPSEANHYYLRGITHERLGEYQKALDSYQLAILNNPESADYYRAAANALRELDRPELAAEYDAKAAEAGAN